MADMQHYEFVVSQKLEGKWRLYRILAIVGYIVYAVTVFSVLAGAKILPLIALVPVTLWMVVYFTWRYTRPDYEIKTESNKLSFTVVFGRTRRPQVTVEFRQLQHIAPLDEKGKAEIASFAPTKTYCAVSSMGSAPDIYYAIWEADGVRSVLYFEATETLLKICRYYNSANTVIVPVSR